MALGSDALERVPISEQPFDSQAPAIEDELAVIWADVPASEWAKLPEDLTDNLDHYIYGTPNRRSDMGTVVIELEGMLAFGTPLPHKWGAPGIHVVPDDWKAGWVSPLHEIIAGRLDLPSSHPAHLLAGDVGKCKLRLEIERP